MVSRPDPAMDTRGEGLLVRSVAFGIDAAVVGTLWAGLWGGGVAVRTAVDGELALLSGGVSVAGGAAWLGTWLVAAGSSGLYLAAGHAIAGQSLGKRMTDLVVVRAGGGPCDPGAAGRRTAVLLAPAPVVAVLDLLWGVEGAAAGATLVVAWLAVEALATLVDDDNRRLGDRLAGTVVVREAVATV